MNYRLWIICIALFALSGCYLPLGGRVIDAETQQPIEGAVVLVQWTTTHGFGFTYSTAYKIAETETNEKGEFTLPGAYNPFVDNPELVIYKQGYVGWRNDSVYIAKQNEKGKIESRAARRTDYDVWVHGYVYKLERFKEGYSRSIHYLFLSGGLIGSDVGTTPKFSAGATYERHAAAPEWEEIRRQP